LLKAPVSIFEFLEDSRNISSKTINYIYRPSPRPLYKIEIIRQFLVRLIVFQLDIIAYLELLEGLDFNRRPISHNN
jgi:hypothetical protein